MKMESKVQVIYIGLLYSDNRYRHRKKPIGRTRLQ